MDPSSLQKRFVKSLQEPPLDLVHRLEPEEYASIWLMGTGIRRLTNALVQQFPSPETLFICDPSLSDEEKRELKQCSFDGELNLYGTDCLRRLGKFQQDTLQVCLACWMIGTVPVSDAISMLYRVLEKNGQVGIICMQEGSPETPLRLLGEAIREVTDRTVDFRSRGQLSSKATFRSNLTSLGFKEERIWSDRMTVSFDDPEELFVVLLQSTGTQWKEQHQTALTDIREAFYEKVRRELGSAPDVSYQYLGATARSKG